MGLSYPTPSAYSLQTVRLQVPDGQNMHSLAQRVRNRLVDSPSSLGARARQRRWSLFTDTFPTISDMRVLDLGGTVEAWQRAPIRPAHVTVLNLFEPGESSSSVITPVTGDACSARSALSSSGNQREFDLVFSNSLIEHVGGHDRRQALADEIRALAPRHWIQTPYRYFPIEPHWIFPLMQFLPVALKREVAYRWPLTHTRPDTRVQAEQEVLWTELVSITEMKHYFPHSKVHRELMGPLTKSIILIAD